MPFCHRQFRNVHENLFSTNKKFQFSGWIEFWILIRLMFQTIRIYTIRTRKRWAWFVLDCISRETRRLVHRLFSSQTWGKICGSTPRERAWNGKRERAVAVILRQGPIVLLRRDHFSSTRWVSALAWFASLDWLIDWLINVTLRHPWMDWLIDWWSLCHNLFTRIL